MFERVKNEFVGNFILVRLVDGNFRRIEYGFGSDNYRAISLYLYSKVISDGNGSIKLTLKCGGKAIPNKDLSVILSPQRIKTSLWDINDYSTDIDRSDDGCSSLFFTTDERVLYSGWRRTTLGHIGKNLYKVLSDFRVNLKSKAFVLLGDVDLRGSNGTDHMLTSSDGSRCIGEIIVSVYVKS